MNALLALALLAAHVEAQFNVPEAHGVCAENCDAPRAPEPRQRSGDSSSAGGAASQPVWTEHRETRAERKRREKLEREHRAAAERAASLVCSLDDVASLEFAPSTPVQVESGTPLFCEAAVKTWLLVRLPQPVTPADKTPSEDLRRAVAVMGAIAGAQGGARPLPDEDAAFLADEMSTALAGGPLRVWLPAGRTLASADQARRVERELAEQAASVEAYARARDEKEAAEAKVLVAEYGTTEPDGAASYAETPELIERITPLIFESIKAEARTDQALAAVKSRQELAVRIVVEED